MMFTARILCAISLSCTFAGTAMAAESVQCTETEWPTWIGSVPWMTACDSIVPSTHYGVRSPSLPKLPEAYQPLGYTELLRQSEGVPQPQEAAGAAGTAEAAGVWPDWIGRPAGF